MRIQSTDNNAPSMQAGLYFTKNSNVLFNKNTNIKYITDEIVQISQEGTRYIEDAKLSKAIKDRFAQITFIKELTEKFETFVHFHEAPKDSRTNQFEHVSYAKISWADYTKAYAEKREFVGRSPVSQSIATEKLFSNLEQKKFI